VKVKMRGYRTYFHGLSLIDCEVSANWEKCQLRGCTMHRSRIDFSSDKVHIAHCDFSGAALRGWNMRFGDEGGRIYNSNFEGATVSITVKGSGMGQSIDRCSFVGADMRGARLTNVGMRRCDLRGADLRGASLDTLVHCSLQGAQVQGMRITGFAYPWTLARLWLGGADLSCFAPLQGYCQLLCLTMRPQEDNYEEHRYFLGGGGG
jgi:uncharacterized protein YjbI with pentapeptide repeats